MNNFKIFFHLLFIIFISVLKCSVFNQEEMKISVKYNKTIGEKNENILLENVKFLNGKVFCNFPNEYGNISFGTYNSDNGEFEPWPKNKDIFSSVKAFEFDKKNNIYILDEEKEEEKFKLYKFDFDGTEINTIGIIVDKNTNIFDFVLDEINDYIYISYYNDSEVGFLVTKLDNKETKKVKLNDLKLQYDTKYKLENEFLNFSNITNKIISITLSCDGKVLFFCPLSSRKIYSILTKKLRKEDFDSITLEDVNEAYKDDASSAIVSGNLGNLYLTGIEKNLIYLAGQIDNDLSIFDYKGIDYINTKDKVDNTSFPTKLSISSDGILHIIFKKIIENEDKISSLEDLINNRFYANSTNYTVFTTVYNISIDKEKSYVHKCAGLEYIWGLRAYIIWGIFILIVILILVFVFIGNKQDIEINKKND